MGDAPPSRHVKLADGHLYEIRPTERGWEARRAGERRWRQARSIAFALVRACTTPGADPDDIGRSAREAERRLLKETT